MTQQTRTIDTVTMCRIAVDEQTPGSYARIMREVSTLSRLQNAHVVRYHQV